METTALSHLHGHNLGRRRLLEKCRVWTCKCESEGTYQPIFIHFLTVNYMYAKQMIYNKNQLHVALGM